MQSQKKVHQLPSANDLVIEETSLELALPKNLVKEVVNAQSEFTAEMIRTGAFEGVIWPKFGKVRVKIGKVHQYVEARSTEEVRKNTTRPKGATGK